MEQAYTLRNDIRLDELNRALDALWDQAKNDPILIERARLTGTDLQQSKRTDVLSVRRDGAGIDPATTAVVVAFAPVVAKIISDVWQNVILPKLLREKGTDALVPKPSK